MPQDSVTVYVVDDDAEVRASIEGVLETAGHSVCSYPRAKDFISRPADMQPYCLIVDLFMPGMNGIELCREMFHQRAPCAFVMISANGDVRTAVEAMSLGAVDFLEKPFRSLALLEATKQAIEKSKYIFARYLEREKHLASLAALSPREREVLETVADGLPTKEIAKRFGISSRTVDVHRSRIMNKLRIDSPRDLAKIVELLKNNEDFPELSQSR